MARLARRQPPLTVQAKSPGQSTPTAPALAATSSSDVHRLGIEASARRARLERGPSIQNASVLQIRNGRRRSAAARA